MRFGAAFWTQVTDWPALRDACSAAEQAGFDTIWIDDHLLADEGDWRASKLEGWSVLAALATITSTARLGLLVAANTFRNPGLTAKMAATLDHLSGGRAILGIGAGWFEREHDAFGIAFEPRAGDRLDRLDESVGLIRRLLAGETVDHEGRFYRMREAVCAPLPIQARLPILIGGSGPKKTLRTTARYADLWNGYGPADRIARVSEILRERCGEVGRDFDEIERTVVMEVAVRDDGDAARAVYAEYDARYGLASTPDADEWEVGLSIGGPPEVVADFVRGYEAIGIREVIWIFRHPFDLESMARLDEVRAALS